MESIAFDLRQTQRRPLEPSHVDGIKSAGERRVLPAGTIIVRPGDPVQHFLWVDSGEVEVVDIVTGERKLPFTLGPGQFTGEIAFFAGGRWTLPMRAARDTVLHAVERSRWSALYAWSPRRRWTCCGRRRAPHLRP